MRRITGIAVLATAVAVALPSSVAASSFDHHFSVLSDETSSKRVDNGFKFKDILVATYSNSVRTGRDKGVCHFGNSRRDKLRCKVLVTLNGVVGGRGQLLIKGNIGHGDNTLLVRNGSGDFNGVAGKITVHFAPGGHKDKLHFDLIR